MKLYQISGPPTLTLPQATNSKQFLLSEGHVSLEATLDKEVYEREEPIVVNVGITNNSSRSVKKIKVGSQLLTTLKLVHSFRIKLKNKITE